MFKTSLRAKIKSKFEELKRMYYERIINKSVTRIIAILRLCFYILFRYYFVLLLLLSGNSFLIEQQRKSMV